jgi:hypothetical protein
MGGGGQRGGAGGWILCTLAVLGALFATSFAPRLTAGAARRADPRPPQEATDLVRAVSTTTTTTTAPPPQSFVVNQVTPLPAVGEARAWGCLAALDYLHAYAAPGFVLECPGDAGGHQAETTCVSAGSACSAGGSIVIADPCPAAYMNEAANSWALSIDSGAPIDPYGACP